MGYHILIVDDSGTTRAMIRRTLKLAEIPLASLREAASGQAALDLLAQAPADLVLADLNMPVMNGLEMIRHMQADPRWRSIAVAVISAEPSAIQVLQEEKLPIRGYLAKPFTPEAVRRLIMEILEARDV